MVRSHRPTPAQLPGAAPAGKIRNTVIKISLAFLLPTVLSKTRTLEAMVLDFSNFSDIPWPTSIVSFPAHCISVFFSHPLWDCQIEGSSFPLTRQWALRSSRGNQIPLSWEQIRSPPPPPRLFFSPCEVKMVQFLSREDFSSIPCLEAPWHPSNKAFFIDGKQSPVSVAYTRKKNPNLL